MNIAGKTIGGELFVIAECGVTFGGDLATAVSLIDAAAEAGADAIKFIFWHPDELMADKSIPYTYEAHDGTHTVNMYEMLSELTLTVDDWRDVKAYADDYGLAMFATVNTPTGLEWTEALDLPAYKLSSWDYYDHHLWEEVSASGRPVIADTGPVEMHELAQHVSMVKDIALMHCYHTQNPGEMNLRAIPYMKNTFNCPVGFSSPNRESDRDFMAVALGADMLEKRLTLDRARGGHHHHISLEPDEFAEWVTRMREARAALGEYEIRPSNADLAGRDRWLKGLVATEDIPEGEPLLTRNVTLMRDGGINTESAVEYFGKLVKRDIKKGEPIRWTDVYIPV